MALVRQPRLVLLDEPLAGLDLLDREFAMAAIRSVNQQGITICLIDHDIDRTLAVANAVVILDAGVKVAEGSPRDLVGTPELHAAYLTS
jgi:branched-chain amino acid transport system ATP-binding protein